MKALSPRRCRIFNCDRHHGNICCTDCGNKGTCKNPCLNAPERCKCTTKEHTRTKITNKQEENR